MKSRQQGITLIGLIFVLMIAGFFAYMGMKLFPPYYHYLGVVKAMKQVSQDDYSGKSVGQIRRDFMYKLSFEYADDQFGPNAIQFVHENGGGMLLQVTYDKDVPFIYNIDFVIHFSHSVPITGGGN